MASLAGTSPRTIVRSIGGGGAEYVVTRALAFVSVPVLLDRLGPTAYGVWVAVTALFALGSVADVGVRTEATRRVAACWGDGDRQAAARAAREGATILLLIGAAVMGAGTLLAPAVVHVVFPRPVRGVSVPQVVTLVRVVAVLVGVNLVGDGFFSVLRGVQRTDLESLCRAVGDGAGSLVAIAWVLQGGGLKAMPVALAVQLVIDYGGRWLAQRRVVPEARPVPVRPGAVRPWLLAGGLLVLVQVSDIVDTQWDKLVLAHYVSSAASAAYAIGTTVAGQAKLLVVVVLTPLVAAAAELHRTRPGELRAVYDRLGSTALALAGVALGGVLMCGPALVHLWLGHRSIADAGRAAQLSAIALWLNLAAAPLAMLLVGSGRPRLPAVSAGANVVVNGVMSVVLTKAVGFDGALYGSIAGNAVGMVVLFAAACKQGLLRLPPVWVAAATTLVAVAGWSIAAGAGWSIAAGADSGWFDVLAHAGMYLAVQGIVVLAVTRLCPHRRQVPA